MTHKGPQDNKLGHKFKILSNSFQRAITNSLTYWDITAAQSFVLSYLAHFADAPPSQHQIEKTFNIKHPTATGILKRLSDKGYVTFSIDEDDRRVKRIIITEAGKSVAASTRDSLDEVESTLSSALTAEELQTLHALLDKLVALTPPCSHNSSKG